MDSSVQSSQLVSHLAGHFVASESRWAPGGDRPGEKKYWTGAIIQPIWDKVDVWIVLPAESF